MIIVNGRTFYKMKIKKIKLKSKRAEGFLESEVLRVVLATICIFLLSVLAFKLYNLFIKKSAIDQAKETIDQLASKMSGLNEGGNDSYMITAPVSWSIMSDSEQICICSFENEKADFFRYENRAVAFSTCVKNGICHKVKNNIGQFDTCGWGSFQSCLDLRKLPLKIYLDKKDGVVSLKTRIEAAVSNKFESILNYRQDEKSKTIRELIFERIALEGQDSSFFQFIRGAGPTADKTAKHTEISAAFQSYLDKIDTKKEFNIEKGKVGWSLKMYKLNDKGETEGVWIPVGENYLSPINVGSTTSSYDIKGYRLMLEIW
ncbi:Uncharacterised protein [uncultured archaeon]|nr:Uncharacterised protein [uncultured archaeon]